MRLYGISNHGGFPLSASNSHFSARVDSGKGFEPGIPIPAAPHPTPPHPHPLLSIAKAEVIERA